MKISEDAVARSLKAQPSSRLYAVVIARYLDPPTEMAAPFETKSINPESRHRKKVEFSFMDLRRVPDEIDYWVLNADTGEVVIGENFFPGGPLLEFLSTTRAQLEREYPDIARQVLSREGRAKLIEQLKTRA